MVLITHKINTVKKFTLCQVLGIGTRQKRPDILGTRYLAKFGRPIRFSPSLNDKSKLKNTIEKLDIVY